jgi:hypothetical protein
MENPRDSSSGGDIGAAGSGDGADSGVKSGDAAATPGTSNQQLVLNGLPATTAQELSQLARAAITSQQGASLFVAGGADGLAGTSAAEQHAALAAGTDSAINALLLNSGINLTGLGLGSGLNLNQAALDGLLSGMPAGQLSGAAAVGEAGDDDGSRQNCTGQPSNKQLSSRFRCAVKFMLREKQSSSSSSLGVDSS